MQGRNINHYFTDVFGSPEEKTDHLVLGDCTDDIFLGYVNNTNANIMGTCYDGIIMAWNDATGYTIMGTCDADFSATYKKHGLKKFKSKQ